MTEIYISEIAALVDVPDLLAQCQPVLQSCHLFNRAFEQLYSVRPHLPPLSPKLRDLLLSIALQILSHRIFNLVSSFDETHQDSLLEIRKLHFVTLNNSFLKS